MGSSAFNILVALLLQAAAQFAGPQKVAGRVLRPGVQVLEPVSGAWATLHRVGSDNASPIDSTKVGTDGRYAFTYTRTGDPEAIYFVSATFGGIAYFTPPLADANVRGDNAEIVVFDTTSRRIPISMRGHHLVIGAADAAGIRAITEVFELVNDTIMTAVASGDSIPVWSAIVPARGQKFRVLQGDIPAAAVTFKDGKANVFAPIAPGLKQLVIGYDLAGDAFPASFPKQSRTEVYEVLIEDPKGKVTGAKLAEVDPIALERKSFRRFLGSDVPGNAVTVIDLPTPNRPIGAGYMIALTAGIGLLMVGALARALRRR